MFGQSTTWRTCKGNQKLATHSTVPIVWPDSGVCRKKAQSLPYTSPTLKCKMHSDSDCENQVGSPNPSPTGSKLALQMLPSIGLGAILPRPAGLTASIDRARSQTILASCLLSKRI